MQREEKISQETLKNLLEYDKETGIWSWRVYRSKRAKAQQEAGYLNKDSHGKVYKAITIRGKGYKASRLAWLYMTGDWLDSSIEIDHINRDSRDNRWINLRLSTKQENSYNKGVYKRKINLPKGVYISGKKYVAKITADKNTRIIGLFTSPQEAHKAYCEASIKLHGKFSGALEISSNLL